MTATSAASAASTEQGGSGAMRPATSPQRIVLGVLADGGWLTAGVRGQASPRLWASGGRLWSLVPRQCLMALVRRGWVQEDGTVRGQAVYSATIAGRAAAERQRQGGGEESDHADTNGGCPVSHARV